MKIEMYEAGSKLPKEAQAMRSNRAQGFTLLELLIVLVIAGLVMSVVAPRFWALLPGVELRSDTGKVVALLRQAQSISMLRGAMIEVGIDSVNSSIEIKSEADERKGIAPLKLNTVVSSKGRDTIWFYPDGSSSGGKVELKSGQRKRVIEVDWLTGQVKSDD